MEFPVGDPRWVDFDDLTKAFGVRIELGMADEPENPLS
jgi:hypothetical protein